ncbi:MAG: hypothetical protein Q7U72_00765 [Brevundimonas sp.]|uniref:hypothetical protein n=1 Tax=Brevundimonas sp. TaxID=1871086 RepID=UPI00272903D7|nr:hypothetical protein [Brevundimonas sp.]MDO9075963.1 hypothetical protein [Brevundimonas sp.]MDP3081708.1 hypothetical protein [Brevundimonas sp.]MDZ4060065.1 hypothetical protein [Brevundimonas sp.]
MTRTKMIGWTAFSFCLLGYGVFTAVVVLNLMGEISRRELLLIGGPAAVIGEIGLWVAAGCLGWSLFRKRKAFFDRVFRRKSQTV